MERILNITVDDVSSLENWEKEALFKTLISEVTNDYNIATAVVSLYIDCRCYKSIPPHVKQNTLRKFTEALS